MPKYDNGQVLISVNTIPSLPGKGNLEKLWVMGGRYLKEHNLQLAKTKHELDST